VEEHLLYKNIAKLGKLSASEKKLADFFEHKYPLIALESLTSISKKVEVGKATVVRFISKLGYKSFADFQKQLQKELIHQFESPFIRYSDRNLSLDHQTPDFLSKCLAYAEKSFAEIRRRIDPVDLLKAAHMMAACKGTIYIVGAGASHSFAHFLWVNTLYLRDRVVLIQDLASSLPHQLVSVCNKDLLFAISSRRYSLQSLQVVKWFKHKDASIILVTDRELTPFADLTTIKFTVPSIGLSMFDSNIGRLLILESLIMAMGKELNTEITSRAETCENLFKSFSTFIQSAEDLGRGRKFEANHSRLNFKP
jgi:DNA-binding MurR/RpiR family transcriptional regulator